MPMSLHMSFVRTACVSIIRWSGSSCTFQSRKFRVVRVSAIEIGERSEWSGTRTDFDVEHSRRSGKRSVEVTPADAVRLANSETSKRKPSDKIERTRRGKRPRSLWPARRLESTAHLRRAFPPFIGSPTAVLSPTPCATGVLLAFDTTAGFYYFIDFLFLALLPFSLSSSLSLPLSFFSFFFSFCFPDNKRIYL